MAQTKRKRRTKHRGNAAGVVESRGRTGRRPTAEERKATRQSSLEDRRNRVPTWKGAFPENHPLSVGVRGSHADHFLHKCDVLFSIGSSLFPNRFSHAIPNPASKTIVFCN